MFPPPTTATKRIACSLKWLSTMKTNSPPQSWLFVDSVFPVRLGTWDLRHYISAIREESVLSQLSELLFSVKTHAFSVVSLEPYKKDGGAYVHFTYDPGTVNEEEALSAIEKDIRDKVAERGGIPSWIGLRRGNVWRVKGAPWREDMSRFASPFLNLTFDSPDTPSEEALYAVLRPYGKIRDISPFPPSPVPSSPTFKYTTVAFRRLGSATIARNVVHGLRLEGSIAGSSGTTMRAAYQKQIHAGVVQSWLSNHPRIVLPVLAFFVGTLTYTVFDPIRVSMVKGKLMNWFDYREYTVYKWFLSQALGRFSGGLTSKTTQSPVQHVGELWKERKDAEDALRSYLSDSPSTVSFLHGPQGSGKTLMVSSLLQSTHRPCLVLDVAALHRASSDAALLAALAKQTGYRPVFGWVNSLNALLDLASVGLIGQKTGLSASLPDQLNQILAVVSRGLASVFHSRQAMAQHAGRRAEAKEARAMEKLLRRERIKNGTWHDGRVDCIAGNGIMSELGVGDERMDDDGNGGVAGASEDEKIVARTEKEREKERMRRMRLVDEGQAVENLPVVVIRNFAGGGVAGKEDVADILARWAAELVDSKVAHVIVISDNREHSKRVAKALPSKPLNSIALQDADPSSALSFVKQKLQEITGVEYTLTPAETEAIQKLGGRASDLESMTHKVEWGQGIKEAVEDMVSRGIGELRKSAFGDDAEDAKGLAWTREQAWTVLKQLSKEDEISYHNTLLDFPFKGDEAPLKAMEKAEFITITTFNGRPSTIKPGKPLYKHVFQRLVEDRVFQATQEISFNEKAIMNAENTVRACEEELEKLSALGSDRDTSSLWFLGPSSLGRSQVALDRAKYLLEKMRVAVKKVEALEKKNFELKKALAKEGQRGK